MQDHKSWAKPHLHPTQTHTHIIRYIITSNGWQKFQWIIVSEIDKSIHYVLHAAFKDDHCVTGAVEQSGRRVVVWASW